MSEFDIIIQELSAHQALLPEMYRDVAAACFQKEAAQAHKVNEIARYCVVQLAQPMNEIENVARYMQDIGDMYVQWRDSEGASAQDYVSLAALMPHMLDRLSVSRDSLYGRAAMAAAFLGCLPLQNSFHSNAHFRDITSTVFRLMSAYIDLYERDELDERYPAMDERHKSLLLIAAAIHDFCHDGKGNTCEGEHAPMRLEEKAFQQARAILQAMGLTDEDLHYIRIMVLCTDVSYGKQALSPSRILSRCYSHFYKNDGRPDITVDDYAFLAEALLDDKILCLLSMLMEEADIFTSVGLSYDYAKLTTVLVSEETEILSSKASTLHGFIEMICHGLLQTPPAQILFSETFDIVYEQASKDVQENTDYAMTA